MRASRKNAPRQAPAKRSRKRSARRGVGKAVTPYARVTVVPKVTGSGPTVEAGVSLDLGSVNDLVEAAYALAHTATEDEPSWRTALAELCAKAVHFGIDTLIKDGCRIVPARRVRSRSGYVPN